MVGNNATELSVQQRLLTDHCTIHNYVGDVGCQGPSRRIRCVVIRHMCYFHRKRAKRVHVLGEPPQYVYTYTHIFYTPYVLDVLCTLYTRFTLYALYALHTLHTLRTLFYSVLFCSILHCSSLCDYIAQSGLSTAWSRRERKRKRTIETKKERCCFLQPW